MSLFFYPNNEDIPKKESINNFENIFLEYINKNINLEEALNELFISARLSESRAKFLTKKIYEASQIIINKNYDLIHKKYPLITKDEAITICSYSYQEDEFGYNPYEILNRNLCEENRIEGIKNISKYFFIFLKALRKLEVYYPKQKYLYRCINKEVTLKDNFIFNNKQETYYYGRNKIFWGFISITTTENFTYYLNNKLKEIKTIFDIFGNIWGYDISLFNESKNEHIILEPESNCFLLNVIPPNKRSKKNIIHIQCKMEKNPLILKKLQNGIIKLSYLINKSNSRIFGQKFVENNKKFCNMIYDGEKYNLKEFCDFLTLKEERNIEIYLTGIEKIKNMSQMFSKCNSLLKIDLYSQFEISNITDLSYMFNECSSLTDLPNFSNWETSNVIDMKFLFFGCSSLKCLPDISKWDISKVTNLDCIFYDCRKLSFLPKYIIKWNTSNVKNMSYMFAGCTNLFSLPDISNWNTSNVESM